MAPPLRKLANVLGANRGELRDLAVARWDHFRDQREPGPAERVEPADWDVVVARASEALGADLAARLAEPALARVEQEVSERTASAAREGPFPEWFNASTRLASLAYALCRELRPAVALETGVANGATSAFILQALEQNGSGRLVSIDWTPRHRTASDALGRAVPDRLRDAWEIRRGPSRRLLPVAARELAPVGLFVSDAVHTYRAVRRELVTVSPHLGDRAALLTDDVEAHAGFSDWAAAQQGWTWAVVQAGGTNAFGAAVRPGLRPS